MMAKIELELEWLVAGTTEPRAFSDR